MCSKKRPRFPFVVSIIGDFRLPVKSFFDFGAKKQNGGVSSFFFGAICPKILDKSGKIGYHGDGILFSRSPFSARENADGKQR